MFWQESSGGSSINVTWISLYHVTNWNNGLTVVRMECSSKSKTINNHLLVGILESEDKTFVVFTDNPPGNRS